jgi:hypothetical protein
MKQVIQKTISLSAFFFLFVCAVHSQKQYFSIGSGYSFNASSQTYIDFNNANIGNNSISYEQINLSLGRGLNTMAAFGIYFNKNVGLDLGVNYLLGSKTTATEVYVGGKTEITYSANMLRLNPSFVFRSESKALNPYARFGFIVGKGNITSQYKDNDNGDIMLIKLKLNGGLAFGFSSAIGSDYKLNDKVSFFGEITAVNMSYAPSYGKAVEASYNGVDALRDMTTSEKEFEFYDSYTEVLNPPDSEPTAALKQKYPFGSIGLNIGLKIQL